MVLADEEWAQLMSETRDHFSREMYAGIQLSHEMPPVSFNPANVSDARATADVLLRHNGAVETPPAFVAQSSGAEQPVVAPPSSNSHPPADEGDFAKIRYMANVQASNIAQPWTANPPLTDLLSATTQQPAGAPPSIDFQSLIHNPFPNVQDPAGIQAPAATHYLEPIRSPTQVQPLAHENPVLDPNPPMNVQDYIDLHKPCNASRMSSALESLNELEEQVNVGFEAFSTCFEVFSKSKMLAEIARRMIRTVMQSNAGAPSNGIDPIDRSKDKYSSTNDTASIDLSKDPRPGARARLAAQKASHSRPRGHVESVNARPPTSSQPRAATRDNISATGRPSSSFRRQDSKNDHISSSGRPLSSSKHVASTPSDCPRDGTSTKQLPTSEHESYGGKSSYQTSAPSHTRQASTDDNAQRWRRHSSTKAVPNAKDSGLASSTTYSSRANGPSNTIAGMAPAYVAHRLRLLERASLPKGNINGIAYNCEARCGYPDSATESLIQCESVFHGKQPTLRQPDGTRGERGWYHGPCGNVAPEDEPNGWICPTCVQRGTTLTNNDDSDDGEDGNEYESGHGDDSEDDFHPGEDTPGESSDDDAGGDEGGEDDRHCSHETGRSQQSNTKKGGKKRRYILSSDSEDGEDDNQGDQEEILPSIEDDGQQHDEGTDGRDANDDTMFQKPVVWKTRAGDPWTEVEKEKTIKHMEDICKEGKITGEDRFRETSRRLKAEGYERYWVSVKNIWNRGLRQRSGLDERRNKRAPMTTSKQDAKTKRENKEKKEQKRRSKQSESVSSRHVRVKREYESEEEEEEEVVPAKRRRAAPHAADYFPGLK